MEHIDPLRRLSSCKVHCKENEMIILIVVDAVVMQVADVEGVNKIMVKISGDGAKLKLISFSSLVILCIRSNRE